MKFSPSVRAVLRKSGLTMEQMIRKVHDIGYPAIEFWTWWEEEDLDAIGSLTQSLGMKVGSVCTKFISLVNPSLRQDYIQGLEESIVAVKRLGCKFLISQTGSYRPGVPQEEQQQSLIAGLREAVPYLEKSGVTLIVEPLNILVDHQGYYLSTSAEAFHVIDQVNSEYVKVVFDIYHQQITEGNLIPNITNNIDKIAYFHVADHPGRLEIGTGEINYQNIFTAILQTGYKGYVGLEYFPKIDGEESLRRFWTEFGHLSTHALN